MADSRVFQGTETTQLDGYLRKPADHERGYAESVDYEGDVLSSASDPTEEAARAAADAACGAYE